jgi:hypothetical protein
MTPPWPPDVTLRGEHAELAPLSTTHSLALADAARDGELWKLWYTVVAAPDEMATDIDRRLQLREEGSCLPFTVIETATARPVGMTT